MGHLQKRSQLINEGAVVLLSSALIFHAFTAFGFYPSACCSIVTRDDVVALDWMDKNLPGTVRILIAASDLRSSISPPPPQGTASDAGGWILPLTGRQTLSLLYGTDFARPDTLEMICEQRVDDIYVGSSGQSFNAGLLNERPDWYKMVLFLPQAKVYRVTGCTN